MEFRKVSRVLVSKKGHKAEIILMAEKKRLLMGGIVSLCGGYKDLYSWLHAANIQPPIELDGLYKYVLIM